MSNKVVTIYAINTRPGTFFKSVDEVEQARVAFPGDVLTLQALWVAETKELYVLAVPEAVKITAAEKFVEDVRRENVKATALSKLSDEEKELLGIK